MPDEESSTRRQMVPSSEPRSKWDRCESDIRPELEDQRSIADVLDCFPLPSDSRQVLWWPPDVFALTARLLLETEGYRFVVSPPQDQEWPPEPAWAHRLVHAAAQWVEAINNPDSALPHHLTETWDHIWNARQVWLDELTRGERWDLSSALLTLHALADQAAAGLGSELDPFSPTFEGRAWRRLTSAGTLSHFPPWVARVLPKTHLGPGGINLRSLSRYLAVHTGRIDVSWTRLPLGDLDARDRSGTSYNLLLLPWPLETKDSDFHPGRGPLREMPEHFGFFEYQPERDFDFSYAESAIEDALTQVSQVDGVLLPEAALSPEEVAHLESILVAHGAYFLVSGIRQPARHGMLGGNYAHIGMWYQGRWHRLRANKHHRWNLDESQIQQYELSQCLDPSRVWWEAIEVPRREMHFLDVGDGATTSVVICEDLARLDVVAEVLRYVGPTLVIALLMDGPQLASRWSARYASVLADDPGSTVLTLTSLGMAQRSCPPGHSPSRVIALWKDPERGLKEISLPLQATAVLLHVGEQRKTVWTADGRQHGGRTPRLVLNSTTAISTARSCDAPRFQPSPSRAGSGRG